MAYLIQPDYVRYSCSCGKNKPITHLYFCRHCLKIRCGSCICHEVDSHYCANCLENMPSSEARLKKNRCISCFDCPSCFHTLSTRATMSSQPRAPPAEGGEPAEPKQPKKMYYLSCFNCRWTSRDVGIPDQPVASGGWPERLNKYAQRVSSIHEYYKALALQEKQEKQERERKKFGLRGKYHTLTDKIGLTGAMARNIAGLSSSDYSSLTSSKFTHAVASEVVNDLPADIFTKEVNLKQITNMAQRLAVAEWQPATVDRLHPIPKLLSIKRSQRCRSCDHNLTKPEYNPGSIKFKIELLAYYHVPEIRIISCEPLKPGSKSALLLKFSNPTGYEMTFRLLPLNAQQPETAEVEVEKSEEEESEEKKEEPAKVCERVGEVIASNAELQVPEARLTLAQRDDAAEYDEDASSYNDHPDLVLWRKSNKMALRLSVLVAPDLQSGVEVTSGFLVEYSYTNTVPPTAANLPRQPQEHTLTAAVHVALGNVAC